MWADRQNRVWLLNEKGEVWWGAPPALVREPLFWSGGDYTERLPTRIRGNADAPGCGRVVAQQGPAGLTARIIEHVHEQPRLGCTAACRQVDCAQLTGMNPRRDGPFRDTLPLGYLGER